MTNDELSDIKLIEGTHASFNFFLLTDKLTHLYSWLYGFSCHGNLFDFKSNDFDSDHFIYPL